MCFHKSINVQDIIHNNCDPNYFMLSTGIGDKDLGLLQDNILQLNKNNISLKFICIDVANGYMAKLVDFCKKVRELYPNKIIIAGNVVTRELVEELILNGKLISSKLVLVLVLFALHDFKLVLVCLNFQV